MKILNKLFIFFQYMLLEYVYYFILCEVHILYKYKVLNSENQRKADKTIFLMDQKLECSSQKEYK